MYVTSYVLPLHFHFFPKWFVHTRITIFVIIIFPKVCESNGHVLGSVKLLFLTKFINIYKVHHINQAETAHKNVSTV